MAKGIAVHVGLNSVDPRHYGGWSGNLQACENDARDMQRIAESRGFESTLLLTRDATAEAATEAMSQAAANAGEGDLVFVSYSGHGGQVPDTNSDEPGDNKDETWVLYDRQLIDDELYALWSRFHPGARIFVLSDSCHSGSVTREIVDIAIPHVVAHGMVDTPTPRPKDMPRETEEATYRENKALYDGLQSSNPSGDSVDVGATVILISGCQDNQVSLDGDQNGLFTQHLREVWADGGWRGSYSRFHKAIGAKMPPTQSPNYFVVGSSNRRFQRQTPFTV
jgi:metacaspase-1